MIPALIPRPLVACLCSLCLILLADGAALAQEMRKPRIASINLCADQLVLALAEPGQILSLGPYARDKRLSYLAEAARAYPQNRGSAESVLAAQADLVIVGAYDNAQTRRLLSVSGARLFTLPPWAGFDAGIRDIRALATAIGQVEAGEALVVRIEAARQAAAGIAKPGTRALVLGRGGYLDVSASLVHDLIDLVGFSDAARGIDGAKTGGAGRFLPLEEVISLQPDILVLGEALAKGQEGVAGVDRKAQFFAHPAFRKVYPEGAGSPRRISLPERLTACGGPSLIEALDLMRQHVVR
jgi:iron complex transport system substrate-binding protein